MSLLIVLTILISFLNSSSLLSASDHLYIANDIFCTVPYAAAAAAGAAAAAAAVVCIHF